MVVTFEETYLRELFEQGRCSDKKTPLPASSSQTLSEEGGTTTGCSKT